MKSQILIMSESIKITEALRKIDDIDDVYYRYKIDAALRKINGIDDIDGIDDVANLIKTLRKYKDSVSTVSKNIIKAKYCKDILKKLDNKKLTRLQKKLEKLDKKFIEPGAKYNTNGLKIINSILNAIDKVLSYIPNTNASKRKQVKELLITLKEDLSSTQSMKGWDDIWQSVKNQDQELSDKLQCKRTRDMNMTTTERNKIREAVPGIPKSSLDKLKMKMLLESSRRDLSNTFQKFDSQEKHGNTIVRKLNKAKGQRRVN